MKYIERSHHLLYALKPKVAWLKNGYLYVTLVIAYLFVITFSVPFGPISPGLDQSWVYANNFLPNSDYVFGRDVVFSHGPLGFLVAAQNIGNNLLFAVIFWLLLQIIFSSSLFYFLFVAKRKFQVILFTICYSIWFILSYSWGVEYQLLEVLGLLLCVSLYSSNVIKYASTLLSGVLACLILFIRISAGMGAFSMLVVFVAIIAISERRKSLKLILTCGASYLVTAIIVIMVYFKSIHSFMQWIIYSLNFASGYGEAMSVIGSIQTMILGILVLLVYLAMVLILLKQKAKTGYAALIFVVPVLIAFKHSFCRQDGHEVIIFFFLLAFGAVLILSSMGRKELITCITGFLVILALTIPVVFKYVNPFNTNTLNLVLGKRGWTEITTLLNFNDLRQSLDKQSEANLLADRLPPKLVNAIGGGTVDVIPTEICYCPANKLKWDPVFTGQILGAFTAALDVRNAAHYEEKGAPDYLIVEFFDIDGRNLLLSTPASWNSILNNYELVLVDDAGRLLLKKKPYDDQENRCIIGSTYKSFNKWIDLPKTDNLLFAKIDIQLNFLGTMAKTFFRVPGVCIELLYESSKIATYRLIPDTASNGLLINFLPTNYEELAAIFAGTAQDRVTKFRIRGDGAIYYRNEFTINWEESNHIIDLKLVNPPLVNPPKVDYNKSTLYAIDWINGQRQGKDSVVIEDSSSSNEQIIIISGWAVDQMAKQAAGGMFINIDGKIDIPVVYGTARGDVAKYFGENKYLFSGFTAAISTLLLDKGQHTLSLKIVSADRTAYYMPDDKINIFIK